MEERPEEVYRSLSVMCLPGDAPAGVDDCDETEGAVDALKYVFFKNKSFQRPLICSQQLKIVLRFYFPHIP